MENYTGGQLILLEEVIIIPGKVTTNGSAEFTGVSRKRNRLSKNVNVIIASNQNVMFLAQDGKLYGFGKNEGGRLGSGSGSVLNYPTEINLSSITPAITSVKSIYGGYTQYDGVAIVSSDNNLYVSGYLRNYPSGANNKNSYEFVLGNIKNIYFTHKDKLVQLTDNTLKSWGENDNGTLGNGNNTQQTSPSSAYTVNLGSSTLRTSNSLETKNNLLQIDTILTIYSDDSASNSTTFKAGSGGGALTLTFPSGSGSTGQYLKTDGSGNLSWSNVVSEFK